MNETNTCIQIINLQLELSGKPIYHSLNLHINCGTLTALVGQNPAAWSILLRQMGGIQPVSNGRIELWGHSVSQISRREVSNQICYIPRNHKPVFAYSVMEYIMQGFEASLKPLQTPQESDRQRALQIMRRLKIERLVNRDSSLLSNSERQLVLLTRALMQNARLLLLEEPFSSLKESDQLNAMSILLEHLHQNNVTAIMTAQDPWLAVQMADQLVVFNDQNIAAVLYRQQPDFADAAEYVLRRVLTLDNDGHLADPVSHLASPSNPFGLTGSLPPDKDKESGKNPKTGFLF